MRDTYVSLQRPDQTTIASHIHVQVDQASTREVVALRQAYQYHGVDYFKVYTFDWLATTLLRRDDILVDEFYIDPDTRNASNPTGTYFRYKIVGRVKNYEYDHQECYAEVIVGG